MKINKRVGSNKACRWENVLKKNKIFCVLIREFRVSMYIVNAKVGYFLVPASIINAWSDYQKDSTRIEQN